MSLNDVTAIPSQPLEINDSTLSNDQSTNETNQTSKKRYVNLVYRLMNSFETLGQAKKFVSDLDRYTYKSKQSSKDGVKIYYLCKTQPLCLSRVMIFMPSHNSEFQVLHSEHDHDHDHKAEYGIPKSVKAEIQKLFSSGITKPNMILRQLVELDFPTPTKTQLNNFLKSLRNSTISPIGNMGALEAAIKEIKEPLDDDQAFVLNHYFNNEDSTFGIFFSTKRLINLVSLSDSLNADATYKLIWNDFPCLIVGTTDKDRHFHPFGLSITSNETSKDFEFIFSSLKRTKPTYSPKYLIADCAQSITNGFESVFGTDYTRIFCWFHVKTNIEKKLNSVVSIHKQQLISDICFLQLSRTTDQFNAACALFFNKWDKVEEFSDFLLFFKNEYINIRSNWHQGTAPGYPLTNNALEATNNVIKNEGTFREKMPISRFLQVAQDIVHNWSIERNTDHNHAKHFAVQPSINTALSSESYNFMKQKGSIIKKRTGTDKSFYFIPSSSTDSKLLTENEINKFIKNDQLFNYRTFDSYVKQHLQRMWIVSVPNADWKKSTCNCPIYLKLYICKHIVGVAIINKEYVPPPHAKNELFNCKRKRGRLSKVSKALEK